MITKIVKVKFVDENFNIVDSITRSYSYKVINGLDVNENDFVAVQAAGYIKVAKVIDILDMYNNLDEFLKAEEEATKYIVDKINATNYINFERKEKRRKFLLEQMKRAKEEADEITVMRALAQSNPKLAALLNEYEQLETNLDIDANINDDKEISL